MAMTNFTEDSNHQSFKELFCSAELSKQIHKELIIFPFLNGFLSVTAFLGNALILVALHKVSSLHPPSKLLFRNLATTDLCVGVIVQPLYATYFIAKLNNRWDVCRCAFDIVHITSYSLGLVSLLTLTAISADRLLALLLGLRYRQVVSLKRTYVTVIIAWLLSIVASTLYFWDHRITLWFSQIAILLCLSISVLAYARILLSLRHQQVQVHGHVNQGQPSQTFPFHIARYRKTVSSELWVQMALVVCYLPVAIVGVLISRGELSPSLMFARSFASTLALLNSSLNPILYCWKIREVRHAVKEVVRERCCSAG